MVIFSKIRLFWLFASFILLFTFCSREENDIIPDIYVDFSIDLNDPEFFDLNEPGGFALINGTNTRYGNRAAGFKGSGIIIYHSQPGEFLAFDRTCPHEYSTTQEIVRVNVDGIYAICPTCNTNYVLPSFGTPISGPGRYPLKNYNTRFDGRFIYVWNGF